MAKPQLWIRNNNSGADIDIDDLGITLPDGNPGTARDIGGEFGYEKLANSDDLYDLIDNSFADVECSSDGGSTWTLTEQDVLDILSTFTQQDHDDIDSGNPHGVTAGDVGAYTTGQADTAISNAISTHSGSGDHDGRYYTESETDTVASNAASSAVSTHASSGDHDGRYYTETELDAFFSGESGGKKQIDWDDVLNKPTIGTNGQYKPVLYRVLETEASSAPSEPGDAAANNAYWYVDDSQHLWKTVGAGWVDQGAISSGDRFIDLNDADESILEWNGASYDDTDPADAYEVTVVDNGDGKQAGYVYDPTSTSWVFRYDVDIDGVKTLDDAYNDGATINVDNTNGPVTLDASSSTSAPIELTQQAAAPVTGLSAGQIAFINGKMYAYDGTRSKWLSVERMTIDFGMNANNLTQNTVLEGPAGVPGKKAGVKLPQNATLVGIIVDSTNNQTANYQTDVKGGSSWTTRLAVSAAPGGKDMTLNVDFSADDIPMVRANVTSGNVDYPVCTLVFAFRP